MKLKPALIILSLLAAAAILAACSTTKGLGQDIENAGSGLKHSAERNGAN